MEELSAEYYTRRQSSALDLAGTRRASSNCIHACDLHVYCIPLVNSANHG